MVLSCGEARGAVGGGVDLVGGGCVDLDQVALGGRWADEVVVRKTCWLIFRMKRNLRQFPIVSELSCSRK